MIILQIHQRCAHTPLSFLSTWFLKNNLESAHQQLSGQRPESGAQHCIQSSTAGRPTLLSQASTPGSSVQQASLSPCWWSVSIFARVQIFFFTWTHMFCLTKLSMAPYVSVKSYVSFGNPSSETPVSNAAQYCGEELRLWSQIMPISATCTSWVTLASNLTSRGFSFWRNEDNISTITDTDVINPCDVMRIKMNWMNI